MNNDKNILVFTSVMLILGINNASSESTHSTKKDMDFKANMERVRMVFQWRTKHGGILGWGGYRVRNMLLISQVNTNQIYGMPKGT
jgi:hypothetical protein